MKCCIDYDRNHVHNGSIRHDFDNGAVILVFDPKRSFYIQVPQIRFERQIQRLQAKGVQYRIIKQNWTLF